MKLSERLQAAADAPYDMTDIMGRAELLEEAAALARRVEGAGIVEAISLMHYADGTGVLDFDGEASIGVGKRVALVPVEGVA